LLDGLGGDSAAPETQSAALAAWSFAHGLALLLMDERVHPEQVGATDIPGVVAAASSWLRLELPERRRARRGRRPRLS